jgi:hypothetical protein
LNYLLQKNIFSYGTIFSHTAAVKSIFFGEGAVITVQTYPPKKIQKPQHTIHLSKFVFITKITSISPFNFHPQTPIDVKKST